MLRSPGDRWDLQRYLLAAQKIFYWNLRRIDAENHQYKPTDKEHPGSWDALCSSWLLPMNLLTQRECDFLAGYKGNRSIALFAMYEQRLRLALPSSGDPPAAPAPAPVGADRQTTSGRADFKRAMVEHVLAIKTQMASTVEVQHLKVPLSYYHLSYLLLLTSLILLAYAFVFINEGRGNPVSLIIYPAIVAVLSGLQEQANKMSDPFGDDETDLNADALLHLALEESRALCFAPHPDDDPPPPAGAAAAAASPGAAAAAAWAAQHAPAPPPPPPASPAARASSAWAEPPPAAADSDDSEEEDDTHRPPPRPAAAHAPGAQPPSPFASPGRPGGGPATPLRTPAPANRPQDPVPASPAAWPAEPPSPMLQRLPAGAGGAARQP
jgi:hypothetical protein